MQQHIDFLTTDKYLAAFPDSYFKTDVLVYGQGTMWRGHAHYPPSGPHDLILAGHSDYPITDDIVNRYPARHWYCVNKQTSRVHGLPLGLTNNSNESHLHAIYGNTQVMEEVMGQPREMANLCYMNFDVTTYPAERPMVWKMFVNEDWVTCGRPVSTLEGRRWFLTQMRNHWYTLCPRGNGVDTHRLWEALYMGSIPIVKRDIAHSDWQDLPILFVDDWSEVTEGFLRSQLPRLTTMEWNANKLRASYWIQKIHESR